MNTLITIPDPCHEDWNRMSPEEQGRFCGKCCKVVVDFTSMETPDVIQFISNRSSEKVCGRFRSDQVSQVPSFPEKNSSVSGKMKVFLAALVLVFGSALFTGCSEPKQPVGEMAIVDSGMKKMAVLDSPEVRTLTGDTVPATESPLLIGKTKCVTPPKQDTAKPHKVMMGKPSPPVPSMLGGPVMVNDTTQNPK